MHTRQMHSHYIPLKKQHSSLSFNYWLKKECDISSQHDHTFYKWPLLCLFTSQIGRDVFDKTSLFLMFL